MKFSPLNLLTNLALKRIGERKIKLCLCRSFSVGTLGTLFFSCGCDWYFCKIYRKHKNTFQNWSHYKAMIKMLEAQNPLSFRIVRASNLQLLLRRPSQKSLHLYILGILFVHKQVWYFCQQLYSEKRGWKQYLGALVIILLALLCAMLVLQGICYASHQLQKTTISPK